MSGIQIAILSLFNVSSFDNLQITVNFSLAHQQQLSSALGFGLGAERERKKETSKSALKPSNLPLS